MKPFVVTIEKPPAVVVFESDLKTATVTMFGKTYNNLTVKRRWLFEDDYLYTIIVPIAKLPMPRYMLSISQDAIRGVVHPERQPFPDIHDIPDFNPRDKKKRKRSEQLPLFGSEGE